MPPTPRPLDFAAMLDQQAPGHVHAVLGRGPCAPVLAHRHAPAHEFHNPGLPYLGVMVVPHYRLTQALFDLGNGLREHICPEPQPVHVLPPDTPYRWTVNGPSTVVMLALPMPEVNAILDQLDTADPLHKLRCVMDRGFVEPLVYEMVMRMWAHTRSGQPYPDLLLQSQATCVVHALVARGSSRRPNIRALGLSKPQLAAAKALMEAQLDQDIGLDELAASCGLSRFHFVRQFRLSTGFSPYQYLLRRRMEVARTLLSATQKEVGAIALAVGFGNAAHFSRTFARHVGLSPLRYRQSAH